MESCPKFLDPRTLAKIKDLHLRARHIVEGYVAGLHRSPYQGYSIEFAEHREYAPGDDLRYVDWKAYGRTDKLYLKQFEDETNLICYLVVDTSESMMYRGPDAPLSKFEYAQCVAAAMAWLVLRQQDSVGLVTFDQQLRAQVRPSSSPAQMQQVIQVLEASRPAAKTSAGPIFHELAERFRKRGVVVILSDMFDDVAGLMAGLKHLRHRRHDVIVMQILDSAEVDFPFHHPTLFKGLEALPHLLADPRSIRKAYLQEFGGFLQQLQAGCLRLGMDYVLVRTDQNLDRALSSYLAGRVERIK